MNKGDTERAEMSLGQVRTQILDGDGLSLPMVIFATIFFSTVLRFVYFLSFVSAACSSARNSYSDVQIQRRQPSSIASHDLPESYPVERILHLGLVRS